MSLNCSLLALVRDGGDSRVLQDMYSVVVAVAKINYEQMSSAVYGAGWLSCPGILGQERCARLS